MKRTIVTTLAIVSACAASASATELDGSISLGASYSSIHGQKAKANEYRALGDGANSSLDLNYRDPNRFLDIDANLTVVNGKQVDQSITTDNSFKIKAGMSDIFKLSLFYDEIPHNLTNGAKTYFNGIGTNALTASVSTPVTTGTTTAISTTNANTFLNSSLINTFDYGIKRTNYGAETELSFKTPFFFTARVDRTETKGLQPLSVSMVSVRELPAPVDYTTDNLFLQTGYRSKDLIITLDGTISNFSNANNILTLSQSIAGGATTDRLWNAYLPVDNRSYKIGGSVMYRVPFWNTTLMARGSHQIMTSNPIFTDYTTNTTTGVITTSSNIRWNGLVNYTTASASITSTPINKLDTRIYYNFSERQNNGDTLSSSTYNGAAAAGVNTPVAKFGYDKQNIGIDLSYKLPAATKVSAGYDYTKNNVRSFWDNGFTLSANGSNPAADSTTDHVVYAQVKNNLLDVVSGKLRYEHLFRYSTYGYPGGFNGTTQSAYWKEYETAKDSRDAIKTELEFEPLHGLDLGLQYAYVRNNYTDSPFGMKNDTRHEIYADATYTAGIAKLNVYGEMESVKTLVANFSGNPTLAPVTTAPAAAAVTAGVTYSTTSNYYRESKRQDYNYAFGGKADVDIVKNKLLASIGYRYQSAAGSDQFAYSTAIAQPIANTNYLDNTIKQTVNAKLTYTFDKNLSIDLGYLFEHLKYTDNAYDGYQYLTYSRSATNGANTYYVLSGAYANPNYDASVVYTKLTYKF